MGNELAWGRQYVMVRPDHFRVDYQINPFMDLADQPDPAQARRQWDALVETIRSLGGEVDVIGQREDAPDMVYAMNLGLGVVRPGGGPHVVMSHMRYAERPDRLDEGVPLPARLGGIGLVGGIHERIDLVVHPEVIGSDHHVLPAPRELVAHSLSPPSACE